ncbi:thioesterase II family protein [Streptomyces sp. NBC_01320]|uniref:thioesterase II family protein n=1 Tax=Streptomyces sp. NBC_01320 TaxID=2903824 RepID=UPI002E0ECB62|nr:alpha/beta fold hydrolase [Streptomyces sp. NBC_01320]
MGITAERSDGLWFRRLRGTAEPALRLACFPHAGGTASMFRGWRRLLPPDVELLAARYPGRQDRIAEPVIESMDELAERITGALLGLLDRPLALFGHSMGSAVAYAVAAKLSAEHGVNPALLVVSGRPAPHRVEPTTVHHDGDEAIIESLRRLGSTQLDVFDDPDLRELLMPALRADYRVLETGRPHHPVALDTPIVACAGISDPRCGLDGLRSWAELTTSSFTHRVFPGDHFYLEPYEADLVDYFSKHLRAVRN